MAKGIKTGGREKGVPNKATAARQAKIAASGITPLEYMLSILQAPEGKAEPEDRKWAAQNAAPYVHPKLANIQANIEGSLIIQIGRFADADDPSPSE